MKYTQSIVLAFGTVAAILGIYAAQKAPYTDIAAGAVVAAGIVGVAQAFQAARESDFVKQMLSHLARSVPPSSWWKKTVNGLVESTASSRGYSLTKILNDASDRDDPEANTIFVFRAVSSSDLDPGGVLVLTPHDYAELSLRTETQVKGDVEALIRGSWSTSPDEDAAHRICDTAVAIYGLTAPGGFRVGLSMQSEASPLIIEVGQLRLSFGQDELWQLCSAPAIQRDLRIANAIEANDPTLVVHLKA